MNKERKLLYSLGLTVTINIINILNKCTLQQCELLRTRQPFQYEMKFGNTLMPLL